MMKIKSHLWFVVGVNTHITPRGNKVATIELEEADAAEDIAVRLGVF